MGLQKKIAYRLRTLREAIGLSQQDVAERAELSLSLIAKMEQGRKADPRASTLLALAGALGVRAGQLIEDLERPPEDAFPGKGKKGKKKKKKARELAAVGAGATEPAGAEPEAAPETAGGELALEPAGADETAAPAKPARAERRARRK
jgi:transcriptional regulator with XRE-family HTH domain